MNQIDITSEYIHGRREKREEEKERKTAYVELGQPESAKSEWEKQESEIPVGQAERNGLRAR